MTIIPRNVFVLWIFGTLIFTFILKNEILASLSAQYSEKIDSIEDVKKFKLRVLVEERSFQHEFLSQQIDQTLIEPINSKDFWKLENDEKVLSGTHVLFTSEDVVVFKKMENIDYPYRTSEEMKNLKMSFFLFSRSINDTLIAKLNQW